MTERKRRRRRRHAAPTVPAVPTLPGAPDFSGDESHETNADAARSALDAADVTTETQDTSAAPSGHAGQSTENARTDDAPAAAPTSSSTKNPPAREKSEERPGASSEDKTVRPARSRLSAKRYDGMRMDALKGALALAEERNEKLEDRLKSAAPVAQAATDDALKFACRTTIGVPFDVLALVTGVDEMRLADSDARKLGDAWAVALAPYLREYANNLPMIAAIGVTVEVAAEKYFVFKTAKERKPALTVVQGGARE